MKKVIFLFFSLFITLYFPGNVTAQEKTGIKISAIRHDGNTVDITLTSPKRFAVGGNVYLLYVGDKEFGFSKDQSYYKGTGSITFLVPSNDFKNLTEGDNVYLTYGHQFKDGKDKSEVAKYNGKCWSLGKFSKKILTK